MTKQHITQSNIPVRVYLYTRVSTSMQIDGYSLEAQKTRMRAYAAFNDYEIAGEFEDAGRSGKSIEGREAFNRMMDDIKSGKDGVSFVLVFKLSRFGRNAADVLSTLQVMQDFGVNLVCVEDGIDSSKDAGKLMISVLSAVAEIERENIHVQTMEGRIQKAREGKWNGGFAPYGYKLVNGQLEINEKEAGAIRIIFNLYVNEEMGGRLISRYLESHEIHKIPRNRGSSELFSAAYIREILRNPIYCGKIAYGRRKTKKVHGTRNDYRIIWNDDYLLVNGLHEGIVSMEMWEAAQIRLISQAHRYQRLEPAKGEHIHIMSGLVRCPVCGAGMYGNKSVKNRPDGTPYKTFYYYGCKHRRKDKGYPCDYKRQIPTDLLDDSVAEAIVKLVQNPHFAALMQQKINMKVDTASLDQEIAFCEKQIRQHTAGKMRLIEEIDALNMEDRHYAARKNDLENRLDKMYDKLEEAERQLKDARVRKQTIEAEKITGDNIYRILTHFEKLYALMTDKERRELMNSLISEIQVYPEPQENGQWLKSIRFRLPIIEGDTLCLDNKTTAECVVSFSRTQK